MRTTTDAIVDLTQEDLDIFAYWLGHGKPCPQNLNGWLRRLLAADINDAELFRVLSEISRKASPAGLHVYIWQRDCDLCEGDEVRTIDASAEAYFALCDEIDEYAEGPYRVQIITAQEAEEFVASFRDRAAEMMNY